MASVLHCEIIQALEDGQTSNIFVICLDRRDSMLNIIDRECAYHLGLALFLAREKVEAGEVDLLVVCSAKDKSFMAGADILTQLKMIGIEGNCNAYNGVLQLQSVFCVLESMPVPTVAILNGTTLGAGLELALSCDFRIADATEAKQIGLPEVKLGVLPGAGGCVRLPRLIGLRRALEMIVTGQLIDGKKALKLGVVDEIFMDTQTVQKPALYSDGTAAYEYQWLSSLLACLEQGRIGTKAFVVAPRANTTAVSSSVDVSKLSASVSQEDMLSAVAENWQECEKKAELKYPKKRGHFRIFFGFLFHALLYCVTFFQVWKKVGFKIIAPYHCLHVTWKCLYAGTWLEAMATNAHGMATLIAGAESAALMQLFLITRKLKKIALNFGLGSSESTKAFKQMDCAVVVYVCKDTLSFAMPFVQSLLFNEIATILVLIDRIRSGQVPEMIREHFEYALKRKYISSAEVDERMKMLSVCDDAGVIGRVKDSGCGSVIVLNASCQEFSMENIEQHFSKVIYASLFPCSIVNAASYPVLMNVGDPVRKNTLTVEITPITSQVPPEHLRCLSALVSSMGKTPIVTPPTSLTACGLHMLLSHWSLAVSLVSVYSGNLSPKIVDKALLSAGYSMGPFQSMKKFGKYYLRSPGNNVFQNRLRKYVEENKIEKERHLTLPKEKIADVFNINLVLTALHVRQITTCVSEVSIDTLCVAGLIQFPPSEAGPLNFAVRLGRKHIVNMVDECTKAVPFLVDVGGAKHQKSLLSDVNFQELFLAEQDSKGDLKETLVDLFEKQKSELVLLSRQELLKVGRTHDLKNQEVLLPLLLGLLTFIVVFGVFF